MSAVAGTLTVAKATAALTAAGTAVATAITLGTAGVGTLYAGAALLAWGGIVPVLASAAVTYGVQSLRGKKYNLLSGKLVPNLNLRI